MLHGPPPRGVRPCIWLSHRREYKPFLKPVFPQHGHSGSGTVVLASDLSLTQVYCAHQVLLPHWLLTMASTCSLLFSEFTLKPLPKMLCPGFLVSGMILPVLVPAFSPLSYSCPGLHPYPFNPHLPPITIHPLCLPVTYLCWDHNM